MISVRLSDPTVENDAIREMLTGLFGEKAAWADASEDVISDVLDWGLNSDTVKKAMDNVASFFKGDTNLINQFWDSVLGGDKGSAGLVFEEWADGFRGIRTEMMALTDLDEGDFINLEEMLTGEGKSPEEIGKIYQTLWTGFSKGLVKVEALTSAMRPCICGNEFRKRKEMIIQCITALKYTMRKWS